MEDKRKFKIAPHVYGCACKRGFIQDKTRVYPEESFEDADDLVSRGFLVEVKREKPAELRAEVKPPDLNKGKKG